MTYGKLPLGLILLVGFACSAPVANQQKLAAEEPEIEYSVDGEKVARAKLMEIPGRPVGFSDNLLLLRDGDRKIVYGMARRKIVYEATGESEIGILSDEEDRFAVLEIGDTTCRVTLFTADGKRVAASEFSLAPGPAKCRGHGLLVAFRERGPSGGRSYQKPPDAPPAEVVFYRIFRDAGGRLLNTVMIERFRIFDGARITLWSNGDMRPVSEEEAASGKNGYARLRCGNYDAILAVSPSGKELYALNPDPEKPEPADSGELPEVENLRQLGKSFVTGDLYWRKGPAAATKVRALGKNLCMGGSGPPDVLRLPEVSPLGAEAFVVRREGKDAGVVAGYIPLPENAVARVAGNPEVGRFFGMCHGSVAVPVRIDFEGEAGRASRWLLNVYSLLGGGLLGQFELADRPVSFGTHKSRSGDAFYVADSEGVLRFYSSGSIRALTCRSLDLGEPRFVLRSAFSGGIVSWLGRDKLAKRPVFTGEIPPDIGGPLEIAGGDGGIVHVGSKIFRDVWDSPGWRVPGQLIDIETDAAVPVEFRIDLPGFLTTEGRSIAADSVLIERFHRKGYKAFYVFIRTRGDTIRHYVADLAIAK